MVEALKNEECCFVERNDDNKEPRAWWRAEACPAAGECSAASFKRSACWSYESHDKVLCYIKGHLMGSSNHAMTESDADEVVFDTMIKEETETFQEREQYRKQLEDHAKKQQHRSRSPHDKDKGKKGKGKGKFKDNKGNQPMGPRAPSTPPAGSLNEVKDLCKAVGTLVKVVASNQNQGGSSSSMVPVGGRIPSISLTEQPLQQTLQVPVRELKLLQASLHRAYFAASKGRDLLKQLSSQFDTEAMVIEQAQEALDTILKAEPRGL